MPSFPQSLLARPESEVLETERPRQERSTVGGRRSGQEVDEQTGHSQVCRPYEMQPEGLS